MADLDAPLIGAFLDHLETDRGNSVRTRNARLGRDPLPVPLRRTAHPEHAGLISRVLAIPPKRTNRPRSSATSPTPRSTRCWPRPTATLDRPPRPRPAAVAVQTGLRVSELTGLRLSGRRTSAPAPTCAATARAASSGATPLTRQTVQALRAWLTERAGEPNDPLFPPGDGQPLSRDAVERLLAQARRHRRRRPAPPCATRRSHRTSCGTAPRWPCCTPASTLSVIALWLGHETTRTIQAYLHADMTIKQRATGSGRPTQAVPPAATTHPTC